MIAYCIFGFVIYLAFSKECLDMLNKSEGGMGKRSLKLQLRASDSLDHVKCKLLRSGRMT